MSINPSSWMLPSLVSVMLAVGGADGPSGRVNQRIVDAVKEQTRKAAEEKKPTASESNDVKDTQQPIYYFTVFQDLSKSDLQESSAAAKNLEALNGLSLQVQEAVKDETELSRLLSPIYTSYRKLEEHVAWGNDAETEFYAGRFNRLYAEQRPILECAIAQKDNSKTCGSVRTSH